MTERKQQINIPPGFKDRLKRFKKAHQLDVPQEGIKRFSRHDKPTPDKGPETTDKNNFSWIDRNFEFPQGLAQHLVQDPETPIAPLDFARNAIMLGIVMSKERGAIQDIDGKEGLVELSIIDPMPTDRASKDPVRTDFTLDEETGKLIRELSKSQRQEWFYRSAALLRRLEGMDLTVRGIQTLNMKFVEDYFKYHGMAAPALTAEADYMRLTPAVDPAK